jgi:hypothetical protein
VVFRTLKLFAFSLDVPPGHATSTQLWWALFLGGAVTARGLAVLFKERLLGVLTAYVSWPRVVIFGANRRASVLIAAEREAPGWWRNAIVVVDPDPVARHHHGAPDPEGAGRRHQRGVAGQGGGASRCLGGGHHRRPRAQLRDHHAARARGPSAAAPSPPLRLSERLLGLPPRTRLDVFVELAGYGLAGILEQGGRHAGVEITPFTAERLTSGWTGGVPDPARFMSPHLETWEEIDEEAKEYDREVLHDVFTAMTEAGVRVVPAH